MGLCFGLASSTTCAAAASPCCPFMSMVSSGHAASTCFLFPEGTRGKLLLIGISAMFYLACSSLLAELGHLAAWVWGPSCWNKWTHDALSGKMLCVVLRNRHSENNVVHKNKGNSGTIVEGIIKKSNNKNLLKQGFFFLEVDWVFLPSLSSW